MKHLTDQDQNVYLEDLYNTYFVSKKAKMELADQQAAEVHEPLPNKGILSRVEEVLFEQAVLSQSSSANKKKNDYMIKEEMLSQSMFSSRDPCSTKGVTLPGTSRTSRVMSDAIKYRNSSTAAATGTSTAHALKRVRGAP